MTPSTPSGRQIVLDGRLGPSFIVGPMIAQIEREAVEAYRLAFRTAWENAKRTKGSVMTDVGEVMAVVDRLIEDEL